MLELKEGCTLVWEGIDLYGLAADACVALTDKWLPYPGNVKASLRLLEPLGPRGPHSPVWLCEGPEGKRVVLKLFAEDFYLSAVQEGLEPVQRQPTVLQIWRWNPSPELCSMREAMAYLRLRHLQGSILPMSYGFFYFVLKDSAMNRPVVGHVMEYIDEAEDPHTCLYRITDASEVNVPRAHVLLETIMASLNELQRNRVAHLDLSCRNMLVQWPNDALKPRLVIFDFETAQHGIGRYIQRKESEGATQLFAELGRSGGNPVASKWFHNEGQAAWIAFETNLSFPEDQIVISEAILSQPLSPSDPDMYETEPREELTGSGEDEADSATSAQGRASGEAERAAQLATLPDDIADIWSPAPPSMPQDSTTLSTSTPDRQWECSPVQTSDEWK